MGNHSTVGQNEALYSPNTMAKRPRLESSLPIYPQRPGEKGCAFYMRTRTCKYGEACKFDHPQWVPEGGVPGWKEVPNVEDYYPERPGEPDCPYLVKSNTCRFKSKCKFNHPKEKVKALEARTDNEFYAKARKCKFGDNRKFNHPMPSVIAKETIYTATTDAADDLVPAKTHAPTGPTEAHNPKGLPIRPGEVDCSFYMKTGSCKFGSICRFNHPYRPVVDIALMAPQVEITLPPALTAPLVQTTLPPPAPIVSAALLNPLQSFDFHATHVPMEPVPIYPQRPGETVCDFYMKTGFCKYSQKCKFHHPVNRSDPDANGNWDPEHPVTLTLAGLPRREDAEACAFYMRSGTCRYGPHCKFDHPPPQEAIAKLQAAGKEGEEKKEGEALLQKKKEGEAKEGQSVVP